MQRSQATVENIYKFMIKVVRKANSITFHVFLSQPFKKLLLKHVI